MTHVLPLLGNASMFFLLGSEAVLFLFLTHPHLKGKLHHLVDFERTCRI